VAIRRYRVCTGATFCGVSGNSLLMGRAFLCENGAVRFQREGQSHHGFSDRLKSSST
jgi:hypothetical protein